MYLETARNQLISDAANSVAEYSLKLYGRVGGYKDLFKIETDLTNSLYVRSGMILVEGKKIINDKDRYQIDLDVNDLIFNTQYFIIMRINMANPDVIQFFVRTSDVLQYNDNLFNNDAVGVKEVVLGRFFFSSTGQITDIIDEIPLMISNTDVFLNNQVSFSGQKVVRTQNGGATITLYNVVYVYKSTQYYVESVNFNVTPRLVGYSTPPFVNLFLAIERATQKVHGVVTPDYPDNPLSSPQESVQNGYTYLHFGLSETSDDSLTTENFILDTSRVLVWSGLANIGDVVNHKYSMLEYANRMFVRLKNSANLTDRSLLPSAERLNYTALVRFSASETGGSDARHAAVSVQYTDTDSPLTRTTFRVTTNAYITVSGSPISIITSVISNLFAEKRRGTTLIIEGGNL